MSEPLYRLKAKGTYSNKSDREIDAFRSDRLQEYDQDNISGTFIFGEGGAWVDLEGDKSKLVDAYHVLKDSGFFDGIHAQNFAEILQKRLQYVYIYHEDRPPYSNKP